MADVADLIGAHVGGIGAGIDTGHEALPVERVRAGVGVVFADLAGGQRQAAITRHGHHATAVREHEASHRRAAVGIRLRFAVSVERFDAH